MANASTKHEWADLPEPLQSETFLKLLETSPPEPVPASVKIDLLTAIQEQIIPKLVLAHTSDRDTAVRACPDARLPPTEEEVAEFAQISVEQNLSRALEFVEAIGREGISLEAVLLQLVAPAARLLGDQWLSDVRTFTDVTFGLATIHQVVNVLGPSFASGIPDRGFVVLVAAPSEQHTLGIYLLAEFIRRAGWGVQVEPSMPEVELIELVRDQHVAMVGISVSNLDLVASLARLVTRVKLASRNHDLLVMVGGGLDLEETARQIGTTFCNDPRDAVRWLEQRTRSSLDTARRI
jgi:methanogenic corrinoid protein MtbC1